MLKSLVNLGLSSEKMILGSVVKCRFTCQPLMIICGEVPTRDFFSGNSNSKDHGKHIEYTERRIVGYSMEQMFEVVSDVERYPVFIPWCKSSTMKKKTKDHQVVDLVVGFPPLVESYTSSVYLKYPKYIRAESTKGKLFNHLVTEWQFSPGLKGRPKSCVVHFHVSFDFRNALTSQLGNIFFNEVVRTMAGAFYTEAKQRFGQASLPSRRIEIISKDSKNEDS